MTKELGKQHLVESSNLKSIGFYQTNKLCPGSCSVRVEFQRGAQYDYWPCSEKEFQEAFVPGVVIKDWYYKFKVGKDYKQIL